MFYSNNQLFLFYFLGCHYQAKTTDENGEDVASALYSSLSKAGGVGIERRSRAKSGHVYSLSNTDDLAKWNVGLVQDFSEMFAWIPCGSKCATNLPQIKTDPR